MKARVGIFLLGVASNVFAFSSVGFTGKVAADLFDRLPTTGQITSVVVQSGSNRRFGFVERFFLDTAKTYKTLSCEVLGPDERIPTKASEAASVYCRVSADSLSAALGSPLSKLSVGGETAQQLYDLLTEVVQSFTYPHQTLIVKATPNHDHGRNPGFTCTYSYIDPKYPSPSPGVRYNCSFAIDLP